MHKIDHIVIGSHTLEEGTSFVEKKIGVKLSEIGYHHHMGTHNRVVKISPQIYLEVIAINPNSKKPKYERWFNLDNIEQQSKLKKSPRIIGYVIENNDLEMLKFYAPFFEASRGDYKWEFASPKSGISPVDEELIESGLVPSLIKWKSQKPIDQMNYNHLELEKFQIEFAQSQIKHQDYMKVLGAVDKLEYAIEKDVNILSIKEYPKFNVIIKDKQKNLTIRL